MERLDRTERGSVLRAVTALSMCAAVGCGGSDPAAEGESIDTGQAEVRDRTKPSTPGNLRITGTTSYSVSLAWDPSSDNSGSVSYRVRHSSGYEAAVPAGQTTFTWTGNLEPRSTYSFSAYAVDAAGNRSNPSHSVTVRLAPDTLPPSTPVVSVIDVGPTHATLGFVSADDGPFKWYTVFQNGVPIVRSVADTFATAHLLEPATSYSFTVQARDFGANLSPLSAPLLLTTLPVDPNDRTPPTVPTNLYEDHAADGEILLQWSPSTDNVDSQAFIRYDILVNGVVNDVAVGRTRSIVYGVDGTNTIAVVARDAAGNVSAAATLTIVLDL